MTGTLKKMILAVGKGSGMRLMRAHILRALWSVNVTSLLAMLSLKAQNLSGAIPPEFSKLNHLKKLTLSLNILNGSIPGQWANMHLVDLSIMGNRLSGPFPAVLTNITTLQNLHLSSNAFTGELPVELSKLKNLTDLRLSDNNISGRIPDFIGSWTLIEKLHMEGCSLEGPIPSSISALTSLSDLRITDLKGGASDFPSLRNMKFMEKLILRNCMIKGEIPEDIGRMENLITLDLSFNNLTGEIPATLAQLRRVKFVYLTGNKLGGTIPEWVLESNKQVDISNNNFSWDGSGPVECLQGSVNMVECYSSSVDTESRVNPCMKRNFPCPASTGQYHYSFHVNCGGEEANVNDTIYESDIEKRGAAVFYSTQNWALSSTGDFMDNHQNSDNYIQTNTSTLLNVSVVDSQLYTTARISPLSLTYYGLCLLNGNYTVKLHFAEILFLNDRSYYCLGRRIFDVYIQGNLVLKDFNIESEAGGTGKPVVKTFNTTVTRHTLKIHFYWAGKGTTDIPRRGYYGPLVSAISVYPNFKPPSGDGKRIYIVVGTIIAVVVLVLLVLSVMKWKGWLGGNDSVYKDLRGLDLQMGLFTSRQIKAATENFNAANKIGEGGFGSVYKGLLPDGTVIAVKQLSSKSTQGIREFVNELGMISGLQHPNLVKLYGCCVEGDQLMLVYEYMENNCLSRFLFGKDSGRRVLLDWPTRRKICLGIARALAYLHEECVIKIIHRDIKTSNVLLDKDFNAKISDFGFAKLNVDENSHVSTRIAGTIGYMAPEYAMRGHLTDKADVYSFGVVALEIVSGKSNTNFRLSEEFIFLLDWANVLKENGRLLELVDPDLGSEYSTEEAMVILNVALLCTNASPALRPTMSQVLNMLEGRSNMEDLLSDPGHQAANFKYEALRSHFSENLSLRESMSIHGQCPYSSSSGVEVEEKHLLVRAGADTTKADQ
ncbi:probable LRR receptor-like serine/threonine-protein kinase At1g07650 isoform X2 [Neltuma alba]|uniref:probable LRR receptor-like serine/threonine-protein kinase At1g07650 isoform X2 n=1 Tax=Neltuma alba TaxID=207710 RepID=UPI0010A47D1D|nr:probable LRR receptor-like serine/threonine-protein kinase At1g07650 isoform X2 [Prosopis alba]